jgi:hypothetical protein
MVKFQLLILNLFCWDVVFFNVQDEVIVVDVVEDLSVMEFDASAADGTFKFKFSKSRSSAFNHFCSDFTLILKY